jgi:PAS domain-containing protein
MKDMDLNLLEVNQIACERLGYTKEELLLLRPKELETSDYLPLIKSRMTARKTKAPLIHVSLALKRKTIERKEYIDLTDN